MLCQLHIENFAIIEQLDLEWHMGMSAITGETGAGKSIAVDALSLCLGARAEAQHIKTGTDKTQVSAVFNVTQLPNATTWLQQQDLYDGEECIVRRVINRDGRSRAYINGKAVPIQQIKQLGAHLVHVHSQHGHLSLLKADHQLTLLDRYVNESTLLEKIQQAYQQWSTLIQQQQQLLQQQQQQQALKELLIYQVQELDEFSLQEGEYEQIEAQHKRLANSELLQTQVQQQIQQLTEQEQSLYDVLGHCVQQLETLTTVDPQLDPVHELLSHSHIQVEEASRELKYYIEQLNTDPEALYTLEQRLSTAIDLARKHHIEPAQLVAHHEQLQQQLQQLTMQDQALGTIENDIASVLQQYQQLAQRLTIKREQAAKKLAKATTQLIRQLNMPHSELLIKLNSTQRQPTILGQDSVEFFIKTNKGQAWELLNKTVSGGELSRISLALQVLTTTKVVTPTLIFDEVDVGISGATAAQVGAMLRQLGERGQLITVTHLPQVAGYAHHHYFVQKQIKQQHSTTQIHYLAQQDRLQELARLLAGDNITTAALANAEQLLFTTK